MSKTRESDDNFVLQSDDLDANEFDELNDETFGDPVMDEDWEAEQDLYNDKMETCLNQLQKVLGDRISEIDLKIVASKYNYNYELALSSILSNEQFLINQRTNQIDNELTSKSMNNSPANGLVNQSKHNLEEIEQNLLNHNETDQDNDLIKNTLDRVANHQLINQIQFNRLLQQHQAFRTQQPPTQHQLPLLLNQQQFAPDLQSSHFLQQFNSPHSQFLTHHLQEIIHQNNNSSSLGNSSSLSDSFASMNLNSNLDQHQNGYDLNNLNQLNNNLRANNNFLINQHHLNQTTSTNNSFMNGNIESTPVKRALTLEEIEHGLLDGRKFSNRNEAPRRMTSTDLESNLLSYNATNHRQQGNVFGFNLNNLNEFPKLDSNEYPKITKTTHDERPNQQPQKQMQFNNNHQFSNGRLNYRNYNLQNNQNRNQNNSNNSRNYHPSLIPNPLNPLEMISNTMINKNNGYKPHQKTYNNQRNYIKNNNFQINKSDDEYAGLMTPKDINWLRRIQHMQLEFDDPYVQDYYCVNYQTRKIASELKKRDKMNGEMHSVPQLVIPERANKITSNESTTENPRYVPPDFSGSLGKIRVANVNYPRKLLDFNNKLEKLASKSESVNIEPHGRTELNKFRRLLLDIERNLTNVLKIDHEDKKIAALPPEAQISHLEERKRLCDELFNGILTTEDNKNVNFNIANIRKGCMLIFKTLLVLEDPEQKTVIISDLLKVDNFHYVVMQKDKTLYCLDYGQVLIDAIKTIKDCDFSLLLKIADGLDDASVIAKFQCGQEIIEVLLNQYNCFNIQNEDQKLSWLAFLERVLEDVDDIPHLRKICNDSIVALTEQ